jgi:hypothetical protein
LYAAPCHSSWKVGDWLFRNVLFTSFNAAVSIDDRIVNEYGAVGGTNIERQNRSTMKNVAECCLIYHKSKVYHKCKVYNKCKVTRPETSRKDDADILLQYAVS